MLDDTNLFHRGTGRAWTLQCLILWKDTWICMHKMHVFYVSWIHALPGLFWSCTAGNAGWWWIPSFLKIMARSFQLLERVEAPWKIRSTNALFQVTQRYHWGKRSSFALLCFIFFRELIVWKRADLIIQLITPLIMRTGKCWRFLM